MGKWAMIEIKNLIGIQTSALLAELSDYALSQWKIAGDQAEKTIATSERVWMLQENGKFLAIAGITRGSFLGEPHFWVLTGHAFAARHLRQLKFVRETLHEMYGSDLITWVESGSVRAEKFAEHFGFIPIEFGAVFNKYRMN